MQSNDLVQTIKDNLARLPLSFSYLGAVKADGSSNNYNSISNKPDAVTALQTNHEPMGYFYKQISRPIQPVDKAGEWPQSAEQPTVTSDTPITDLPYDKVFTLFACCLPVKGAVRSLICDVQRQHFDFIPHALYTLLTEARGLSLADILRQYGAEHAPTIIEYFGFLTEQEYGFWADGVELAHFPPLDLQWNSPFAITNGILDIDAQSSYDIKAVLAQLDALGCPALQLRCYDPQPLTFFEDLLEWTNGSRIKCIDLLFPWYDTLDTVQLATLAARFLRLNNIIVHSAPFHLFNDDINNQLSRIIVTKEVVTDEHHCGLVSPVFFAPNLSAFTESLHFNSCLNRKISVDKKGRIKNCPALPQHFGHVADTALQTVLAQPDFTRPWHITKDDCAVCRDCEFRYICTDCRAHTQLDAALGKPLHCHYNPYTAEWEAGDAVQPLLTEKETTS